MSLIIKKLTHDLEAKWNEYAVKNKASIYHDTRWIHLIKRVFGHDSFHIIALEGENVVGILPLVQLKSLLFGNFLVSMPYFNYGGVIADNDEITNQVLKFASDISNQLSCSHIEMRFDKLQEIEHPVRTDKVTMLLDLPDDSDQLWKAIGSKRRAQVKRPIREGVEFVTGGEELLDEFYDVFSQNMRDLGTPVYSKCFFKEILKSFSDNVYIAVVRLNGEAVGTGFLIGNAGKLEIPWASTLRKYNRIGINMYMYWNILKFSIDSSFETFDFGRSSKDAGTLKFKKQWGATEKQLYWYYDLMKVDEMPLINPNNSKYLFFIKVWKKLPLKVTRLMGPKIVKNIP